MRSLAPSVARYSQVSLAHVETRAFRPAASLSSFITAALLFLASSRFPTASAARIEFENCLDDGYIYTSVPADQAQLQFIPLAADAVFDTKTKNHNLEVTVWGNVTGRVGDAVLPSSDSPEWNSSTGALDGKIQDTIEQGLAQFNATTLHSSVEVLSYQPYENDAYFCKSLLNSSCPLGPVFNDTFFFNITENLYSLPSFQLSNDFHSSYALATFAPTLIIRYGDQYATQVGCISAIVTPSLGDAAWSLRYLPLVILILVGFATVFAAVFSPWGTTDIFHWTSNYGRDPDLLRLVTPGFGDCLNYIQFVVLSGSLSLDYPGYYQPVVSQASWSILMFDEQFVSKAKSYQSIVDGIYIVPASYGMERIAQLSGMGELEDVWAGMIIWVLVIIAAVLLLTQTGFLARVIWRLINRDSEEDLRAKNIPFSIGNVTRIVFNFFLLPIIALSAFQLVVAAQSPAYLVVLAVLTLALIIGFAAWLMHLIVTTKPRSHLFDDLPVVLLYGPLYNTYCDEAAAFALVPIILTLLRGIAIGAVQPSGTAQIVILAVCEVIQILALQAFRPFHSPTSMNAYHFGFSALRFVSLILMVPFFPSLGLTEGTKGWIGYAILLIHGSVLVFGFLLNALQTIIEVIARLCGAADDDIRGQTRGGLSKIFGARQLSRRVDRGAPSRQSQLSSTAMLDASGRASSRGYGRVRSESAGSMGILMNPRRNSSAMDTRSVDAYSIPLGSSTLAATTPREASTFSFLPSPGSATRPQPTADPYYRPPRARRGTLDEGRASSLHRNQDSLGSIDFANPRHSLAGIDLDGDAHTAGNTTSAHGPTAPAPYAPVFAPRADYSTREVDFYYGVRGPALNSEGLGRKLGTGPADPTSPVATATGWLKRLFGGKTKESGKGFEVVRSSRMPPAMKARGGDLSDEAPEGIPVALGVLRKGPIESDDEDDDGPVDSSPRSTKGKGSRQDEPDSDDDEETGVSKVSKDPPLLPDFDAGSSFRVPSRVASRHASQRTVKGSSQANNIPDVPDVPEIPEVPRKSSKRNSSTDRMMNFTTFDLRSASRPRSNLALEEPQSHLSATARLPFDRSNSQKRLSGSSTALTDTEDLSHSTSADVPGSADRRPASLGYVNQHNISKVELDQGVDLLGSSAEVVDDPRKPSPNSSVSRRT
ncbi:integral membrane protein [Xylariaceae sp. FL1272]|nr:integral membrane protein [Xylariaceae sp. FL1272]